MLLLWVQDGMVGWLFGRMRLQVLVKCHLPWIHICHICRNIRFPKTGGACVRCPALRVTTALLLCHPLGLQVLDAVREGVDVRGFYYWSLLVRSGVFDGSHDDGWHTAAAADGGVDDVAVMNAKVMVMGMRSLMHCARTTLNGTRATPWSLASTPGALTARGMAG